MGQNYTFLLYAKKIIDIKMMFRDTFLKMLYIFD